ncbi:hypothetical protein GOODEAATRI_019054, partial [Goodea atripinnis]
PPTITGEEDGATERKVVLSKHLILECKAAGHPPPSLTWLKDGIPVRHGESVHLLEQGRKLEIFSATISDSGRYICISDTARFQCLATNEAGDHERNFNVTVQEPPSIPLSGDIINQTVLSGFSTELECKASGSPLPGKTDHRCPPPHCCGHSQPAVFISSSGVLIRKRGQVLEIEQAQLSDAGMYRCVAVNLAGTAEKVYRISSSGGTVTAVVNEAVKLECEASGVPVPSLTWLKDGSPVASVSHGIQLASAGRVLSLSSAQIKDAKVSDTGRYTCIAVNAAGQADSKHDVSVHENVSVVVKNPASLSCEVSGIPLPSISWLKDGRPVKTTSLVRILSGPDISAEEITVTLSSPTSLVCEVQSYPPALITWLKDGTLFESTRNVLVGDDHVSVIANGRIVQIKHAQVAQLEDSGRYTCVAINEAGEDSIQYNVRVL